MELLVKNIIKQDLKIKFKIIYKWAMASLLVMLLSLKFKSEVLRTFTLFITFIGFFISVGLNSFSQRYANNTQQTAFSWKYIHSINFNRQLFIKGHLVVSLFLSVFFLLHCYLNSLVWNIEIGYVTLALDVFIYFLFVTLLKLTMFYTSLNQRNLFNYKYSKPKLKIFILLFIQKLLFWGSYCGTVFLFFVLTVKANPAYLLYFLIIYLILTNILLYKKVIRCWKDERELRFDFKRDLKNFYIHIFLLLIAAFLNFRIFGEISLEDNRLKTAISNRNFKVIDDLIKSKRILNQENDYSYTALTESILRDDSEIAEYLIKKGADVNIKIKSYHNDRLSYRKGMDAFMLSIENGNLKIADLLLRNGANINALNDEGLHSIHIATLSCSLNSIEFLYNKNIDLNIKDKFGRTALFYVGERNCLASLLFLIKLGADTKIIDKDGLTFEQYLKKNYEWFYRNYEYYNQKIK